MKKRIGIVGGSCVDIFATSALPLIAHDSNPGTVNIGFGGVGRNIAENLARLQQNAVLIAPFGQDPFSVHMKEYTQAAGVCTEHCLLAPEGKSPYYISVNDSGGDMAVAISDLNICDFITPEFLELKLNICNTCQAVIVDTNIPKESIDYLAAHCAVPLLAEAVSTRKAIKLRSALPRLNAVKANLLETAALLDIEVNNQPSSLQYAADCLHAIGIAHVFITMGKLGAFYSTDGVQIMMESYQTKTVNTNGCGDAFSAAAFLQVIRQKSPETVLQFALAAAAITAQSTQAVAPRLSPSVIDQFLVESRNE